MSRSSHWGIVKPDVVRFTLARDATPFRLRPSVTFQKDVPVLCQNHFLLLRFQFDAAVRIRSRLRFPLHFTTDPFAEGQFSHGMQLCSATRRAAPAAIELIVLPLSGRHMHRYLDCLLKGRGPACRHELALYCRGRSGEHRCVTGSLVETRKFGVDYYV